MIIEVSSENEMKDFGVKLGQSLRGGQVLLLIGDVGAGKTTLTKGIASGMGVTEDVQSPTFTISRVYDASADAILAHYDFYRLHDAGIMVEELHESVTDPSTVTVIEWGEIVNGVVPEDHLEIRISSTSESSRRIELASFGVHSAELLERLAQ